MPIETTLETVRELEDCEILPPAGQPETTISIPEDLSKFYELCGGMSLFSNADYGIDIVPPDEFERANPVIVGEDVAEDISFNWFIIAKSGEQYITIDLSAERFGHCYDSFWDRHGIIGETQIIAKNFENLLDNLIRGRGTHWYWLSSEFENLGDAYD